MEAFEKKVKEKQRNGVSIGFGLRGNPALSVLFERMVNIVRLADPATVMMFNTGEDLVEVVTRNFPELKGA